MIPFKSLPIHRVVRKSVVRKSLVNIVIDERLPEVTSSDSWGLFPANTVWNAQTTGNARATAQLPLQDLRAAQMRIEFRPNVSLLTASELEAAWQRTT